MPILNEEDFLDEHFCDWPTSRPKVFGHAEINQHHIYPGTIWKCDFCGDLWLSVEYPDVRHGLQTVGNKWVNVRTLPFWQRRKVRRRARNK